MTDRPSKIGRYEIVEQIGRGGMGALYLAQDPVLGRRVVIKVLRQDLDDDEVRHRFLREARSAGGLSHPNIVTVFDLGEHDGKLFIAMEYLPGETLAELIRREAPFSLDRKLHLIEDLCAGLAHAHKAGLVHRDIKPSNIMVGPDGTLKILDFGIARLRSAKSSITQAGVLVGSLNYMSPEQIVGRPIDQRSDVFSVGLVFYELLSYRQAFPGGLPDIIHSVLNGQPQPLITLCPGLDPEIEAIVARSLEKDVSGRYQDLVAMRQDIQRCRVKLDQAQAAARDAVPASARSGKAPDTQQRARSDIPDSVTIVSPPPRLEQPTPDAAATVLPSDSTVVLHLPSAASPPSGLPAVQLVVTRSADLRLIGRAFEVASAAFLIGRQPSCDLTLPELQLSRRHAVIEYINDAFVIRDLGSRNGTFVNGRQVHGVAPLFFGASISIGATVLMFSSARDTSLPDLTGCEVAGRYLLTKLLRESAKGAVYVAQDKKLPSEVAVKLLSPELVRFPGYLEQFRREADTAAQLQHPHICRVLDYGSATLSTRAVSGICTEFLCCELMAGGNLADRLTDETPVPLEKVARWIAALADALDHSHRHGVVHGDLKPTAVVFDSEDNPYLTDFAIAQRILNAQGQPAMGTPAYMAPEQWDEGSATPAVDQFALAVLAYQLVTGAKPFEAQDNPEVRHRNLRLGPMPAHEEAHRRGREGVARAVSDVLRRGLATSPADRYASVGDFAKAFVAAFRRIGRSSESPQVFLSYQRDPNSGWAVLFARELKEKYGIGVFVDVERRDGAGRFPTRLARAIEDCDVFVCLLGSTTLDSKWVREEIRLAHQHSKPMIPVFQESYAAPTPEQSTDPSVDALTSYDGVHLLDRRNIHVDHTIADLARLVKDSIVKTADL